MNTRQDIGVARQIGSYSDGVEVPSGKRWLVTSGTPGLALDGTLPADITGQAELAWTHIRTMLEQAQMTVDDIVKVTQYLLNADDIKPPGYPFNRTWPMLDAWNDSSPACTTLSPLGSFRLGSRLMRTASTTWNG